MHPRNYLRNTVQILIALVFASLASQSLTGASKSKIGAVGSGYWALDQNGNNAWDGTSTDGVYSWTTGNTREIAVQGDWNGDGRTKMGVYLDGVWILDYNGNGVWDGPDVDKVFTFGSSDFVPIVGDWNHTGWTKIGIHCIHNSANSVAGQFLLDYNGNFAWDDTTVDKSVYWSLGNSGEIAVIGDWNGDGNDKIGIYSGGYWVLDYNGNNAWDGSSVDRDVYWSIDSHDIPVVGNWNGQLNSTKIGVYSDGHWMADYNGNFILDGQTRFAFFGGGNSTFLPAVGDWNDDGKTKIAAYLKTSGTWWIEKSGNWLWDGPSIDVYTSFGGPTYVKPIVGNWKPNNEPDAPAEQSMEFLAPQAPAEGSCGPNTTNPNCTRGSSNITFVAPTQIFGESKTYTTGPDRYHFYNYTSNSMRDQNGSNLGLACSVDTISFADNFSVARVPCSTANFRMNVLSSRLYKLDGLHRAQSLEGADSGIFHTYYSLGLVAAGSTWDTSSINIVSVSDLGGAISDARTATGPLVAPGSGGVTATYNSRTQTAVDLHIDVPYTAVKGRINFSFPTTDIYGNASPNQAFSIIVFDATPLLGIGSVTPSPLLAGTQSALTITGTGFGDHPTIYVDGNFVNGNYCSGGTVYNPGLPSRIDGKDVVTVQVNLPISKAGTSVPICVKSNGAGGAAFFGAPQGNAPQGLPTSNTVQLALQGPPTISGENIIWWLGRASVNDNCVPNSSDPTESCYYNSAKLTAVPGSGARVPSASLLVYWSFTDRNTGQSPSYLSTGCIDAACTIVSLTAVSQPPICGRVDVKATFDGIVSQAFGFTVDRPDTAFPVGDPEDYPVNQVAYPGYTGYQSHLSLVLTSACSQPIPGIDLHEEFPAGFRSCGQSSPDWRGPVDALGSWQTYSGSPNTNGVFGHDTILFANPPKQNESDPPQSNPEPQCPGKPVTGQCVGTFAGDGHVPAEQLSNQANAYAPQFFFVGSRDVVSPGKYFAAAPLTQVRYTDHGRDEPGGWTCPIQ